MPNRPDIARIRRALADERGNCFLYGCVTLVVVTLLGGLVIFLSLRYVAQQVREQYTEATPAELPTVEMAESDVNALVKRVDAYAHDLREGAKLAPITLTEADINALLQNHPDLKETYGDHMYITLGDNEVTAQMSLPLDWIPTFGGRFFNGTATFDAGFLGGRFQIYLNSASVKGEEVPRNQIQPYRSQNFGERWEDDSDARSLMDNIESIMIKKEGVTIVPRNKSAETDATPPAESNPADNAPADDAPADDAPAAEAEPAAA